MTGPEETFTKRDFDEEDADVVEGWRENLEQLGHLYRYLSIDGDVNFDRFMQMVVNSQMFFTPFLASDGAGGWRSNLNDPFDGVVRLRCEGTAQEIRDLWMDRFAEDGRTPSAAELERIEYFVAGAHDPAVHRQIEAAHSAETAALGVRCFSELPDDLPMWGYYADSHRGVCLRFRAPQMLGWGGFPPIRITYADEYPNAWFYRDTRFRRIRATLATKAKVWCHEREWRMVRPHGLMTFNSAALDGVIIGASMPPEIQEKVRAVVAQRRDLKLLRARPAEREFKLLVEPA